jgi:hypothetical protein
MPYAVFRRVTAAGSLIVMLHDSENGIAAFRALYPEISDAEIPAAYECFRRYVQLAIEIAGDLRKTDLTPVVRSGTVSAGQVDPKRTFTNTG